jgi:hypothetical protein
MSASVYLEEPMSKMSLVGRPFRSSVSPFFGNILGPGVLTVRLQEKWQWRCLSLFAA